MEVAVLVGLQASGKTTFCRAVLARAHVVVSKDDFARSARNRQRRQLRLVSAALAAGSSVAVDNTNPSADEWSPLIAAARSVGADAVAYWFPPAPDEAFARNAARADPVPDVGFFATLGRLREPTVADGFDRVYVVGFDGSGGFVVSDGR